MHSKRRGAILMTILPLALGGCIANTAANLAAAPFKVAGQAADWATTSRDEADRNCGRAARKSDSREHRRGAETCSTRRIDCDSGTERQWAPN